MRPALFALAGLILASPRGDDPASHEAGTPGPGAPRGPVVLRGETVSVEADVREGRLLERYSASRGGNWIEVATSADGVTQGAISLVDGDGCPVPGTVRAVSLAGGSLVEEISAGGHRIVRTLTPAGGPWLRVQTRLEPSGRATFRRVSDGLRFAHPSDWSYSPSVGGFNPDAWYKAPLILVQSDRTALGIVPDVAALDREALRRSNHALDLDVPGGPILSVGFLPARRASHSVYALDLDRSWTAESPVESSYLLLLEADAEPGDAFRSAVRLHWDRFGRAEQRGASGQQAATAPDLEGVALWDDWRAAVWGRQSRALWLRVALPDGSTGGAVRTHRWGPGPSVYLSSWFNAMRTAHGMALHARRTGDRELGALAGQTLAVALKAPGRDGAFKCIAVPAEGGGATVWAAGDGSGGSTAQGFLGYDMSWTAYWLLRWRAADLPGSDAVLPRCRELARFLMDRQLADGMLPTRFAEDGSVEEDRSRTVKAETGPVALFLLELHDQDPDPRYLESALRGLAFLEAAVIPTRQWYDYETFWSCSPRVPALDARTRQWPANDLALGQAVAAYLAAHRATAEDRYLEVGRRLLDYLLLYQQCWTNPVLDGLSWPSMLLGGFTTQNSDAEWSDARQSQFGSVILDWYRATGDPEYLERGVAALRAQFPVSPSENWAHEGYGGKAGVSSFHWGTGSGMAGVEIEEDFLRDAVVDVAMGRAVGVNGLDVNRCQVGEEEIRLELTSPFRWTRPPVVTFHRADPARTYRIAANGDPIGAWRGEDLEKGVALPIEPFRDGKVAPKPLYRDPVHDGAADATIVWSRGERKWIMLYTNRRANVPGLRGVSWVHGTRLGIAESPDGGATWSHRGVADVALGGPDDSHWAPEVVWHEGVYHMFLSFVPGMHEDWSGTRWIHHLKSADLVGWTDAGRLPLASDRVIDACVFRMPDGSWRMWYNDERARKAICRADSPDLETWTDRGKVIGDQPGEGPKVVLWRGKYWMVVDQWAGLGVYRSDDAVTWERQSGNLLATPGLGEDDQVQGGHPDVVVSGDRAWIFYFTHPGRRGPDAEKDTTEQRRSSIQVAELEVRDGRLACDRDRPARVRLIPPER